MRLFATFREKHQKVIPMEMPEGTAVVAFIDSLDIAHNEIAILLVNGRHATLDHVLKDGDVVSLFPPVGGG